MDVVIHSVVWSYIMVSAFGIFTYDSITINLLLVWCS